MSATELPVSLLLICRPRANNPLKGNRLLRPDSKNLKAGKLPAAAAAVISNTVDQINIVNCAAMNEIGPFRSRDYLGNLELQGMFLTMSKQLRLQRLKEVRESERQFAQKRSATYRQCIDERKSEKVHVIRDQMKSEKMNNLHMMKVEAKKACDESGLAHQLARSRSDVAAKEAVENAKIANRRAKEDKERQRIAGKIRHEELVAAQRPALRQFALHQVRKELRQSEREDAHAIGETYAARQQILEAQRAALDSMHAVPPVYTHRRVQQGAVSIEQRFPVEVHARIIRHGARGGNDRTMVHNAAVVEEGAILRKNWQAVMREMTTRLRVKARAKVAELTVERKKGVQFLDSELQQLETADKSHGRLGRVNSAMAVPPDIEPPRLQGAFEKVFLNKPVRLEAQQAVYRTGARLSQATLEKRAHWLSDEPDWGSPQPERPRQAAGHHPGWVSTAPRPTPSMRGGASGHDLGDHSLSTSSSSCGGSVTAYSEEGDLSEVRTRRVSEDFYKDAPVAMHDIPNARAAAPKFIVRQEPSSPESVAAAPPGSPDHVGAFVQPGQSAPAAGATSHHTLHTRALAGLQVRVPRVSGPPLGGDASTSPRSHGSASPTSFSTGSSIAQSGNLSIDDSEIVEEGPLSIDVRRGAGGSCVLKLEGSVTPPRHASSRPSDRRTGTVDPFTPPEVHEPRPALAGDSPARDRLDAASPTSFASSSNTEQARHDRSVSSHGSTNADTRQHGILGDSNSLHSSHVGSASMTSSTSSALAYTSAFKGIAASHESVSSVELSRSPAEKQQLMAPSTVAQCLRISLGSSTSGGSGASSSTSSVYSSEAQSSASVEEVVSRGRASPPQRGTPIAAASLLSSSTSSGSGRGSQLQSASGRSSSSSSLARSTADSSTPSSSSSSMLSYLQSSPFAVTRAEVVPVDDLLTAFVAAPPPVLPPAQWQRNELTMSRHSPVSDTQSVESDSISALSGGTTDIRLPAHSLGLSREEVQEVLRNSGSVGSEEAASSVSVRNMAVVAGSPPRTDSAAGERGRGQEGSPYDAMYDSWGDDQFISVRVGPQISHVGAPAAARMPPVAEDSLGDSDDNISWSGMASARRAGATPGTNLLRSETEAGPVRMALAHEHLETAHSFDRRSGTSEEGSDREARINESDELSQQSQGTDELLEKWSELYEGSLSLGDRARAACSAHLSAYGADASHLTRPDEASFLSDMSSPVAHSAKANQALPTAHARIARVPASPLDAFAAPAHSSDRTSATLRSPQGSISERSEHARSVSSSDSVSAGLARESYDFSHAERVMGALDELSANWESRHTSTHIATEVQRSYSATSHVTQHRSAPVAPPAVSHSSSCEGSMVGALSRDSAASDFNAQRSNVIRNTYAGRLVIHREQRPMTRSSLIAQLGLDESLLDTSSEEEKEEKEEKGGAVDRQPGLSSDDDQDDASLEELLRGPYSSGNTVDVLRSELSGLVDRLRGHTETAATSRPLSAAPPVLAAAQVLSSGEDTYSSGRYYSAGEAHNTSSSTMHTAESGERASAIHAARTVETRRSTTTRLNIHTETRTTAMTAMTERVSRLLPGSPSRLGTVRENSVVGVLGGSPQRGDAGRQSALDVTPSSDAFSSPSAFSGSRLSEYALLSQHTLSATRLGSPGSTLAESPINTFPRPPSGSLSDHRSSQGHHRK